MYVMVVAKDYFFKKVTLLNVFLTFCIVLLHAKPPERWGLPLDTTYGFIYWTHHLTLIGVPTFFFLSGLLFYRRCSFSTIERKLKARVHSLLVPYLLWNVVFVAAYYVLTHIPAICRCMNMGFSLNTLGEIAYAIINARCTDLWFVKNLMLFCACSAFLFICVDRLKFALLVLSISIAYAISFSIGYEHPMLWLPSYLTGAIVGRHFVSDGKGEYMQFMKNYDLTQRLSVGGLLGFALFLLCLLSGSCGGGYTFVYRLGAPLIIWLLIDLTLYAYISKRFVVRQWMRHMFFIFCVHHFVLNCLQKIVVLSFPPTNMVLNLTFVLSPLITVAMLLALANMLSRYRIFAVLTGGR